MSHSFASQFLTFSSSKTCSTWLRMSLVMLQERFLYQDTILTQSTLFQVISLSSGFSSSYWITFSSQIVVSPERSWRRTLECVLVSFSDINFSCTNLEFFFVLMLSKILLLHQIILWKYINNLNFRMLPGPLCVEFACSAWVLWSTPTVQRQDVNCL